jgi:2-haloacid dehalogenase
MDRWATFDCYGTLIDWNAGIVNELGRLFPDADITRLLADHHEVEADVQKENESLPYREALDESLMRVAERHGLALPRGERKALVRALPTGRRSPTSAPLSAGCRMRDGAYFAGAALPFSRSKRRGRTR